MASHVNSFSDEPVTPASRLFLQPELDAIIHCVIGVKHPIDIDAIKVLISNGPMIKHPRFCSLMVRDQNGVEYWKKTQIDIDKHVIIIDKDNPEFTVNDYLADLSVSTPLSIEKPLWEIHLLLAHKCAVLRLHHSMGDGISLISLLLASCRRADDAEALPKMLSRGKTQRGYDWSGVFWWLWGLVTMVSFSLVFMVDFVVRTLWVRDRETAISGGAGVELWPRKVATARFWLEDMKAVKKAVPDATINDVLFGVISFGLSRYLERRSPNALKEGHRLTGVSMVNLREQPGLQDLNDLMRNKSSTQWGNKIGIFLLPVYYHKSDDDPLEYVKRSKAVNDRKKQSLEAHFSYIIGNFVMSWLGAKYACLLNYRLLCNTTFTISNVVGPQEEITIAGNPVTQLMATSSSLPHALTMHMVSYAGRADMQILVAKDMIPDPEFLAKCFENALLKMKQAAAVTTKI
ncbi:WES_acyltransf domain-containing protein/DUF1298 domain-containing protein [Cephalotus follicularis]|uniref:WES_acyltransf domain-containing protein/DUF1298 domain-containing protein n=1 Tax=Cephalotus follicularis TaxID=3775 RepID=A0A1Q3CU78_CEPFO|nr:WES_acyltransf domain-containing protein/DUF1298 domain-containing protein [Cephalotus follicularis]